MAVRSGRAHRRRAGSRSPTIAEQTLRSRSSHCQTLFVVALDVG
jgi:hypothetical protein